MSGSRQLAAAVAALAFIGGGLPAVATADDRNGCVPDRGFQEKAEVGKTKVFAPARVPNALLVCRPHHPVITLLADPGDVYGGPAGETSVVRVAGPFIEYYAVDEEAESWSYGLIDGRSFQVAMIGAGVFGVGGSTPAFSASGYVAATFSNTQADGSIGQGILSSDGRILDGGPAAHDLRVVGMTASWIQGAEPLRRTAVLTEHPTFKTFEPFTRVPPKVLRRFARLRRQR